MVIVVIHPQLGEHFPEFRGVVIHSHRLMIGGQNRVFLAPDLIPVDLLLCLFTDTVDHLLGLPLIKVKLDELVQGHMVQHSQPLGLTNIRQSLVRLPFGDGLAADPQLFRHILLGETAFLSGMVQTASYPRYTFR